ncbi:hypothetical protein LOD99_10692, partial [Oopsacas minuta]
MKFCIRLQIHYTLMAGNCKKIIRVSIHQSFHVLSKRHRVRRIDWPSNNPDLNPIENLWGVLKHRIMVNAPKTIEEVEIMIYSQWETFEPDFLSKFTSSMKKGGSGFKPPKDTLKSLSTRIADLATRNVGETFSRVDSRITQLEEENFDIRKKCSELERKNSMTDNRLELSIAKNVILNEKVSLLETQLVDKDARITMLEEDIRDVQE